MFICGRLDTVAGLSQHEVDEGRTACARARHYFLDQVIPRESLPRERDQDLGLCFLPRNSQLV